MRDTIIGSLDGRQLHLRWIMPLTFEAWDSDRGEFRFSLLRLLSPVRWWLAIFDRYGYECWWRFYRDSNSRCYCPVGSSFRADVKCAGWGVIVRYSHYTGPVPCCCDIAWEEWKDEQDELSTAAQPQE